MHRPALALQPAGGGAKARRGGIPPAFSGRPAAPLATPAHHAQPRR